MAEKVYPQQVPLLKTNDGSGYWFDANQNDRVDTNEIIKASAGVSLEQAAIKFFAAHPWIFSPYFNNQPTFLSTTIQAYYDHPSKRTFANQLDKDVVALEKMKDKPKIYSDLLADLKIMKKELPFVRFETASSKEILKGFVADYDPTARKMRLREGAPDALIVHEMDHRLTADVRLPSWSRPYKILYDNGYVDQIPKNPKEPLPKEVKTSFSFSLDYLGHSNPIFTFNNVDAFMPVYFALEHGHFPCLTPATKNAALANEVRGYLTMCRYLLFRIGVTSEELKNIDALIPTLEGRLQKHLAGSSLNYEWAFELLKSYFGRGGISGRNNLSDFIDGYYTNNSASGFVDPPDCVLLKR